MTTATSIITTEFGGFPFVDAEFAPGRLLTAVACCRYAREHAGTTPGREELAAVLQPDNALRIRRLDLILELPHAELTPTQLTEVDQTRRHIGELMPRWQPLLDLPLAFLGLRHSKAISSSNFAWPQHIFLAEAAFASPTTLAEQVLHEISHQWLYFIEEMWPLQEEGSPRFTLPSGTGGRSASELLGASHVVVNPHQLWSILPADADLRERRLRHLRQYGARCQGLLDTAHSALTTEGQTLAHRLSKELRQL